MLDEDIRTAVKNIKVMLDQLKADYYKNQDKLFKDWDAISALCPHNDVYETGKKKTRVCRVCKKEGV